MGKINNITNETQLKKGRTGRGNGKPGYKLALLMIPADLHRKRKAEAVLSGISFQKYLISLLEKA